MIDALFIYTFRRASWNTRAASRCRLALVSRARWKKRLARCSLPCHRQRTVAPMPDVGLKKFNSFDYKYAGSLSRRRVFNVFVACVSTSHANLATITFDRQSYRATCFSLRPNWNITNGRFMQFRAAKRIIAYILLIILIPYRAMLVRNMRLSYFPLISQWRRKNSNSHLHIVEK